MLLSTVSNTLAIIGPPPPSGIVVTGVWEFVHVDGSITNGTWTHDGTECFTYMSKEPLEYAEKIGKTGLQIMWWDSLRQRKCIIREYRNGKEDGYWIHWYPTGQLQSVGILSNGLHISSSFWHTNGFKSEINISTNSFDWSEDGKRKE